MPLKPDAVGAVGDPVKRSWSSKDSLLYAVGVGAGTSDLSFTTENTKDTPQKVLPTFAVIIGSGGAPMDKVGSTFWAVSLVFSVVKERSPVPAPTHKTNERTDPA